MKSAWVWGKQKQKAEKWHSKKSRHASASKPCSAKFTFESQRWWSVACICAWCIFHARPVWITLWNFLIVMICCIYDFKTKARLTSYLIYIYAHPMSYFFSHPISPLYIYSSVKYSPGLNAQVGPCSSGGWLCVVWFFVLLCFRSGGRVLFTVWLKAP